MQSRISKRIVRGLAVTALLFANVSVASPAQAQDSTDAASSFSSEELAQIVAPIALYPDSLISQILMASTYPLEVVQADRWAKSNEALDDKALEQALDKQHWDPSVKSLVNFPDVLNMMSVKLDWTTKLGDAFIGQQAEVLAAVQTLRSKAHDAGNLQSNAQQIVVVESSNQTIVIESSSPNVVYVPTYNPVVVYGAWPYHGYRFRMLTRQGENAQGGARSYVFDGRMIGGFALIAWPATHGNSGVMTFIVNQDGTVYDKDLGRRTDSIARAMTIFDPDESWFVVNETPYVH